MFPDAVELLEVVTSVDEVEAAPLSCREWSEDEVRGECAAAETLAALLDLGIHVFECAAEAIGEFLAIHRRPAGLARTDLFGCGDAARESSAANDEELQDAVFPRDRPRAWRVAGKIAFEERAGVAIGEDEMLDDFLRCPGVFFAMQGARRAKLAPITVLAGEALLVALVKILENRVHACALFLRWFTERGQGLTGGLGL